MCGRASELTCPLLSLFCVHCSLSLASSHPLKATATAASKAKPAAAKKAAASKAKAKAAEEEEDDEEEEEEVEVVAAKPTKRTAKVSRHAEVNI